MCEPVAVEPAVPHPAEPEEEKARAVLKKAATHDRGVAIGWVLLAVFLCVALFTVLGGPAWMCEEIDIPAKEIELIDAQVEADGSVRLLLGANSYHAVNGGGMLDRKDENGQTYYSSSILTSFSMFHAPFREFFPLIVPDGDFDLSQNLFVGLTDGHAQGGDGSFGVEVEEVQKILMLEIAFRLQTAARHHSVGDTYRGGTFESHLNVKIIMTKFVFLYPILHVSLDNPFPLG